MHIVPYVSAIFGSLELEHREREEDAGRNSEMDISLQA